MNRLFTLITLITLAFTLGLAPTSRAAAPVAVPHADTSGRYIGTLTHDALGREQLAELEWIGDPFDPAGGAMALFILHFGDFANSEYVAYHFDTVIYERSLGVIRLLQADQDVSLQLDHVAKDSLDGTLVYSGKGRVGRVHLQLNGTAHPKLPLLGAINGEYRGRCDDQDTVVQLTTFKSTNDTSRVGNSFGFFQIIGQWGEQRKSTSMGGDQTGTFVLTQFDRGSYNYFTGELDLNGFPAEKTWRIDGDSLTCEGCPLRRVSQEGHSGALAYPQRQNKLSTFTATADLSALAIPDPNNLTGEYHGFVYHEYLDIYQPVSMNIEVFPVPQSDGTTKTEVSAVASLYFGPESSGEALSYRFIPVGVPSEKGPVQFTLSYLDKDVDPIVRVSSVKNGVLEGIWYSQLFGKVGAFKLYKSKNPPLPKGLKTMAAVAGNFAGGPWTMQLRVALDRTPPNSDNPFSPLDFGGNLRSDGSANIPISGGSYDFYTGRIAIFSGSGRTLSGGRDGSDGEIKLRVMSGGYNTLMSDYAPLDFFPVAFRR